MIQRLLIFVNISFVLLQVYNLCFESNKIYPKNYFGSEYEVALFPISDHCCCPIQYLNIILF